MAYPEDMVYLRYEFAWKPGASDVEIQDFGMWGIVRQQAPIAFPGWQDVVDALSSQAVEAWTSNVGGGLFAGPVKARRVVAYHYDQAHLEVLHRGEAVFDGANQWQGTGDPLPPQLSVVCTTFGFDPAGFASQPRRKRGRFYLPTPGRGMLGSDGELDVANQTSYTNQMVLLINDLTDVLDIPGAPAGDDTHWRPYVSSTAGLMATKISHIRIGRTIDTQRRRRNKLPEAYQTAAINV